MNIPPKIPLYVFTKAPIPGRVKTRLHTHCSALQAAQIAEILLVETVRRCTQYWPGETVLSVGNDPNNRFVVALAERFQIKIVGQSKGDLGMRMNAMFCTSVPNTLPAAIIGADVSMVEPKALELTHTKLLSNANVIGPSEDGGYYLIGLVQACPELFEDIEWGTSKVLEQTRCRAETFGVSMQTLPSLIDIDEWEDVFIAKDHIPALDEYLRVNGLL